jgi:hypothetical protein
VASSSSSPSMSSLAVSRTEATESHAKDVRLTMRPHATPTARLVKPVTMVVTTITSTSMRLIFSNIALSSRRCHPSNHAACLLAVCVRGGGGWGKDEGKGSVTLQAPASR